MPHLTQLMEPFTSFTTCFPAFFLACGYTSRPLGVHRRGSITSRITHDLYYIGSTTLKLLANQAIKDQISNQKQPKAIIRGQNDQKTTLHHQSK